MIMKIDRVRPQGVYFAKDKKYGEYSGAFVTASEFEALTGKTIADVYKDNGRAKDKNLTQVEVLGEGEAKKKKAVE